RDEANTIIKAFVTVFALSVLVRGKQRRRTVPIFLTTLSSATVAVGIVVLGSVPVYQMAKEMADALGLRDFGLVSAIHMVLDSSLNDSLPGMIWVLVPIFAGVAFCAAWIGSLAILARFRRVPVSVGIVRGVAGGALPVASVLLLAYAAVTVVTLRIERQGLAELAEMTRHEGRYYARLAGKPWPGLPANR
ncbi:MAG: hypothetical protein V4671_31990, partial [Armatimonadota bacterium]